MTKYQIMEQKPGQSAKALDLVPIYAETDCEAAEKFTQWALNWLQNRDGQEADDLFLELSVRDVESFFYDSAHYYVEAEEPADPAPEMFTCERCGSESPADECFRVLIDPEDGHSDRIEICLDCYAEIRGAK